MNVPVKEAARIYGKDPQWVRIGLQRGYLPIGVATKREGSSRYSYYISPKLLYEHTGERYEKTK